MVRSSEYGSPFRNVNSGIDESKDKVNVKRYDAGLKKFMTEAKGSFFLVFSFSSLLL